MGQLNTLSNFRPQYHTAKDKKKEKLGTANLGTTPTTVTKKTAITERIEKEILLRKYGTNFLSKRLHTGDDTPRASATKVAHLA